MTEGTSPPRQNQLSPAQRADLAWISNLPPAAQRLARASYDLRVDAALPLGVAHVVYRLLDEAGRVVYVGSSRNVRGRLKAHRRTWPGLIAGVLVDVHPDASAMLTAERAAIAAELPSLNVAGVG